MSTATTKTKKPLHKRVWVWVLAVLALFVLIGALGSGSEDAPPLAEVPTTTAAATEPAAPTTTPAAEVSAEAGAEVGSATEAEPTTEPTTEAAPEPTTEEPEVEEPAEPEMTTAQRGAVRSATSYVDLMGFSRQGLIGQLTSEYGDGYDLADAEFAVSHLESTGAVDWNEEAVQSAESYIDLMGFSRQGLIDQLTSEYGDQYTQAQAEHAADAVGL